MKSNNNQNTTSNNFVARKISSGRDNQTKKSERSDNPKPVQVINNLPFKISSNNAVNKINDRPNNHNQSESNLKSHSDLQSKNRDDSDLNIEKTESVNTSNFEKKEELVNQNTKVNFEDKNDSNHRNHQHRQGKNRYQHQRSHGNENKDQFKNKDENELPSNPQDFKTKKLGLLASLIGKIKKLLGIKKANNFSHKKHHRNFNHRDSNNHRKRKSRRNRNSSNHGNHHRN
ncbi:hypothetical protein LBMAG18_05800 [Alphaproteobacteria bacterium]|nr:hypothetical protein LBMAG18_05800 [Alphaproteobacteria bacterium]